MTRDDILKLKAATLYILKKYGTADYIHLFKTLYFAERKKYAEYGSHLVKDSFCALPLGPVPSFLYDAVKNRAGMKHVVHEGLNIMADALIPGEAKCVGALVSAAEAPDMDWLSEVDVEMLDWAYDKCKNVSSRDLSQKSHDEAWREAYNKRYASPMDSIAIAKAGGASDGFAEYLMEQEQLEAALA